MIYANRIAIVRMPDVGFTASSRRSAPFSR